jgi:hypothetical protein
MKTFKEIRNSITEAMYKGGQDYDQSLMGDKKKFLDAAKKFKSEFQFGYFERTNNSIAVGDWLYDSGWGNPDSGIEINPSKFDKSLNQLSKLKSFGATHVFCYRVSKKEDKGREILSIRFKGKNDKIALGMAKWYGDEPVFGKNEEEVSIMGSLALGTDKFSPESNKLVKKYGTSKTLDWKKLDSADKMSSWDEICIIEL